MKQAATTGDTSVIKASAAQINIIADKIRNPDREPSRLESGLGNMGEIHQARKEAREARAQYKAELADDRATFQTTRARATANHQNYFQHNGTIYAVGTRYEADPSNNFDKSPGNPGTAKPGRVGYNLENVGLGGFGHNVHFTPEEGESWSSIGEDASENALIGCGAGAIVGAVGGPALAGLSCIVGAAAGWLGTMLNGTTTTVTSFGGDGNFGNTAAPTDGSAPPSGPGPGQEYGGGNSSDGNSSESAADPDASGPY